ncbi:MAG: VWA domain-containing protein [Proteobacteria bacterium]|nr:VWA domain-containing protein [Pseudomonadota bacterium]MBU1710146.1 VWA domain-containing protein [Pseudomonadota bacterium]
MKTFYFRSVLLSTVVLFLAAGLALFPKPASAAVVANDGGITLWISYDNLDVAGASLDDTITEADVLPGGFSCDVTNAGRSSLGAPDSPPSCPGGTGSCTGREKIEGDIEKLADYIYAATEGGHYLRRVYVSDQGRAWTSADIKWNTGVGGSSAPTAGWVNSDSQMSLNSGYRTCIHDIVHHELGHYFYRLPDRYAKSGGYYQGTIDGSAPFQVDVTTGDPNTVMSSNFPHLYVDTTNARIVVDYDQPGPGSTTGEVLTPGLLSDADADNDGPDRAHHYFTNPFAQDEWSLMPSEHADLSGVHTEGIFADPGVRHAVDIVFIGDDEPHPGTVLLLDRSGSMGVTTDGITAAQFVQEAGMFLYHSSEPADIVGTYLYNASVEELFPYAVYDETNDLAFVSFRNASGLTNIALVLETAIDQLIATHGEAGVSGAEIYLMSDGRQTTGASLWDQVTRANERGIKIHTFSFGNADATTMDSIASGTSGTTTAVSERDDAAELKMIMTRKFSTGRGKTPIFTYKGKMEKKVTLGKTQIWGGQFDVPPKTRELQFYAFLHVGDASKSLTIHLEDPGGTSFTSASPNNVAQKGRFNGVDVSAPKPGTWKYYIAGIDGSGLPNEKIEIAAYADNRELKGRVWFEDFTEENRLPVRAELSFRYPLTDLVVDVSLYMAGDLITVVPMKDDGSIGVDNQGKDGIYSALIDLSDKNLQKLLGDRKLRTQKLRAEVNFKVTESSRPAPYVKYEPGTDIDMIKKDYVLGNKSAFKAWATGVINLADRDKDDRDKPRIIIPDWKDIFKIAPGKSGKFVFKVVNLPTFASQLRVSLGQGVEVTVEETKPDQGGQGDSPGQSYLLRFTVDKEATHGTRDLKVQFGGTIMAMANVLDIGDKPCCFNLKYLWIIIIALICIGYLVRKGKTS